MRKYIHHSGLPSANSFIWRRQSIFGNYRSDHWKCWSMNWMCSHHWVLHWGTGTCYGGVDGLGKIKSNFSTKHYNRSANWSSGI